MSKTEQLKEIIQKHTDLALQANNTQQDQKRLKSLNEILEERTFVNPKYFLFLDDVEFFLRAYIEGTKAWFWIRDGENAGNGEYLIYEEVKLKSTDEEKTRFNKILDYFMDKGEIA